MDMIGIDTAVGLANRIRPVVQVLGGKFMTSPELAEVEAEVGLPQRSLYLRGRSAVLGDVPPKVAAELFGIFPHWLFEFALPPALVARQPFGGTGARSPRGPHVPHRGRGGRQQPRAVRRLEERRTPVR